ncbi:protein PHTF2-like [Gigantopelta aegis]|uniref:protein PHTF2-like n=1 Tax=Gigantopelta aegis TaxID=1735272 RepID=UPI001B88C5D0|nr:protein PHTF2-like [Gigantopelta aegis]
MDKVHNAVAWYQKKIGAYDKQFWEQSVEKKLRKGQTNVHHASKKIVRLKTEFIDVDLIRGSTFSKAKPQVPWIYITRKTTVRLVFLPLCFKWWVQQTSWKFYFLLLVLYFMQVTSLCIYVQNVGIVSGIEDEVSLTEVMTPMVLMMVLGFIHTQTMLSHYSHKALYRDCKLSRRYQKSKKRNDAGTVTGSGQHNKDQSRSRDLHSKTKANRQRNINVTSTEDLDQELASSSVKARSSSSREKIKPNSSTFVLNKNKVQCHQDDTSLKTDDKCSSSGLSSNKVKEALSQRETGVYSKDVLDKEASQRETGVYSKDVLDKEALSQRETGVYSKDVLDKEASQRETGVYSKDVLDKEASQRETGVYSKDVLDKEASQRETGVYSKDVLDKETSQRETGVYSKDVLDKETIQSANQPEGVPMSSENHLESRVLVDGVQFSDDDACNGRFEVLSVDQLDINVVSGETASHLVLPQNTTGEILTSVDATVMLNDNLTTELNIPRTSTGESLTPVGQTMGVLKEELMTEVNSSWKTLECYKKRLLEEDNFADTEHASDECPSDTEPESGSFNGSSANEPEIIACNESCVKEQDDSTQKCVERPRESCNSEKHVELNVVDQERSVTLSGTILRRRRRISASRSADIGEVMRSRNLPISLGLQKTFRESTKQSSSENETTPTSEKENRVSSEEWENRMHSDVTTSSSYSSSCGSEAEGSESGEMNSFGEHKSGWTASSFHVINLLQPPTASNSGVGTMNPPDEVSCVIWEGNECRKVDLTAFDIGWAIIDKVDNIPESSDYVLIGIVFTLIMGCFPLVFRAYNIKDLPVIWSVDGILSVWQMIQLNSWRRNFLTINGVLQRLCLSLIFFFLLSVADRTFKQRLLYAKHFCYLTSSRRARKFDMPHFRLNKVRNIKIWLSLRSYLKRRGPQRSVDIIVSASFLVAVSLVTLMCLKMLKDTDTYLDYMCNWEIVIWCLALGTYLLRFMTLGLKINKKYRSLSVLITEQINLYLQMEQKPHKKEELMLANNVLKLAEELLKELESPFKISGFSANPFIYNVTKVVVLSAFSAVLTELLGFKLKLYKIKFKA